MPRTLLLSACLAFCLGSCATSQQTDEDTYAAYQSYVPPPWAPPYDNVSVVRYYYLPDYGMYYDVWDRQFWYPGPGGEWMYATSLPPMYSDADLNGCFVVLIDRDESRPWERHEYYRDNYPRHGYDNYRDIVVHNRVVTNIEPGHELVPRAFNENNNRVTFMQRPVAPPPPPGLGESRSGQQPMGPQPLGQPPPGELRRDEQTPGGTHLQPQAGNLLMPQPPPVNYHHKVHEVPMRSISPSMPEASRKYNYGGGYTKGSVPARSAAPARQAAPQKANPPQKDNR